ncbi:hypothetical protein GOARA_015_00150 [Gordonia araii NBRC 100433]|uniref:Uncharacterized protein n=1 Tax=Gordonia araii NBRC 100433 TaxID=1073574 RepID=G7GYK2_9ACTN|nr:hypothetical protein [Gordonia araii]NNG97463.1 hypothetical protein [Gordonia araii NBRC 100433]GAB08677.1 hypothetical protein GOARA_015_00150 [Gordonia araii NBRC 100433]
MHEALAPWADFNVAIAGASAALAGLIIVAVSVNLERILVSPAIPARTGAAIGALTLAVAAACLALIPDQSLFLLGLEILIGAVLVGWLALLASLRIYRIATAAQDPLLPKPPRMWPPGKIAMSVASPLLFVIGGAILLTGDVAGLNWIAAGSLTAIVAGVALSWIVLIEVRR